MNEVRIENWSVCHSKGGLYDPPEMWQPCLSGNVYGHPRKPDGHSVSTSPIVDVNGRLITTATGTIYLLGQVDPLYVEHCEKHGLTVPTEEVPIKGLK